MIMTSRFYCLFQSKTAAIYQDTQHITRLRVDCDTTSSLSESQYSSFLPTSDSMPLLAASILGSRCPSSISMDQLSTMTAVTSFIDDEDDMESESASGDATAATVNDNRLNVQNLIVISNDPSPEVRRRRRSDTGNKRKQLWPK